MVDTDHIFKYIVYIPIQTNLISTALFDLAAGTNVLHEKLGPYLSVIKIANFV